MTYHITTIIGSHLITYQIGKVCLVIFGGIRLHVSRVIYLPTCIKNLLSFQDICRNGFHLRTFEKDNQKLLQILDHEECTIKTLWHAPQTYTSFL